MKPKEIGSLHSSGKSGDLEVSWPNYSNATACVRFVNARVGVSIELVSRDDLSVPLGAIYKICPVEIGRDGSANYLNPPQRKNAVYIDRSGLIIPD